MNLEKSQKAFKNNLSIISLTLLAITSSTAAVAQPIGLRVKQDAQVYNLLELDSLILRPKPFKYLVQFPAGKDIKLNHSYTDSMYKEFKDENVTSIKYWGARCMAEASFNSDKEILLASESWSCWFYDQGLDFHRLDAKSIRKKDGIIKAKKSVITLHDVYARTTTNIRKASRPIYVIIAYEAEEKDHIEYFHCCKIIFEN